MKQPFLILFFLLGLTCNALAQLGFDPKFKAKETLFLQHGKFETICSRMDPEIDSNQIIVLGHGLGAYLIPYFQKCLPSIHAFISINGNFSQLPDLLVQQNSYLVNKLAEPKKNEAKLNLQKAIYAQKSLSIKSKTDSLPYGFAASYWLFLKENGPTTHVGEVVYQRILFLQGNRDYQVPISELEQWKLLGQTYAIRNWTYSSYTKLNHLGLEGEGPSLPDEYLKANNIPYEVILRIAGFVLY